jgi:hypothetical protein
VHNLHDAAAARLAPAWDIAKVTMIGGSDSSAAKAREDVVDFGHKAPND